MRRRKKLFPTRGGQELNVVPKTGGLDLKRENGQSDELRDFLRGMQR